MAEKVHVKKGDKVLVLNGKDRGKTGKILSVKRDKGMVVVEGVNMSKKHKKAKGRYQQSGIVHQESAIYSSKVMLICNKCGEPTRFAKKILESGEKARICKKCNEVIDIISRPKED